MRKWRFDNRLRSWCSDRGPRRSAFSLAELVVSMGILVLMLALVGQVFNLTVASTGQATALSDLNQALRAMERTLREDLANVQPGESMLLIQGNPVNAFWENDHQAASTSGNPATGYPHQRNPVLEDPDTGNLILPRADVLMMFTAHRATSQTDPGVSSNLQQVVYGHAELGEYVAEPVPPPAYNFVPLAPPAFPVNAQGYPDPNAVSPVPAENWHLARRSVLILPKYETTPPLDPLVTSLDDVRILRGETDIIARFQPSRGPVVDFDFDTFVLTPWNGSTASQWFLPPIFERFQATYGDPGPFARSQLDVTPPPLYANRLAHYMLPRCASFKIEWSLNPRSDFVAGRLDGVHEVLWIDQGVRDPATDDPLASMFDAIERDPNYDPDNPSPLEGLLDDRTLHPDGKRYSFPDRFRGDKPDYPTIADGLGLRDDRPNLVAFTATRTNDNTGDPVRDDVFPSALRMTVDVYDPQRRLDRPVRHVMVIPVGSG
jgi:type II secretory pathway pseudopilin PulG